MSDDEKRILNTGTKEEKLFILKKRSEAHLNSMKINIRLFLIFIIIITILNFISFYKIDVFFNHFSK